MKMLKYVKTEKESFEEKPLGECDALALTWISYFDMSNLSGKKLGDLGYLTKERPKLTDTAFNPKESRKFFNLLTQNPRFKEVAVEDFTEIVTDEPAKFASITLKLPDGRYFVSFRGTDPTYESWQEIFTMSYKGFIPSQHYALNYLKKRMENCPGKYIVTGHSKGANLALFAYEGLSCEYKERTDLVYSFEPPGFPLNNEIYYSDKKAKVYLPETPFVGGMFSLPLSFFVVKSTAFSVIQHNCFSWKMKGGQFERAEKINPKAYRLIDTFNLWVRDVPGRDKEDFTRIAFRELHKLKDRDFNIFFRHIVSNVIGIIKLYKKMEGEEKELVKRVLKTLKASYKAAKTYRKRIDTKEGNNI